MWDCKHVFCAAAVLAVVAFGAAPAAAGLVTYPNFASWNASVTGITSVTIPDPAPAQFLFFGTGAASVTYSGVVFSTNAALSNGSFFNIGTGFSGSPAVLSSQEQSSGVANILITFPSAVNGFALNYGTFNGSDVTFLLSNGDTFAQGGAGSGYAAPYFAGATDLPFTSVLVTSPDYVLNLNNVSYAPVTAIPEPSSLAIWGLLLSGVAGAGYLRRRWAKV